MRLLNPMSLSVNALNATATNTTSSSSSTGGVPPLSPTALEPIDIGTDLSLSVNQQVVNPPTNLLVLFLQSCSAILQETKIESTYDTVKMFSIILVCITEDNYANSLLHDSTALYSVFLYHAVSHSISSTILTIIHFYRYIETKT